MKKKIFTLGSLLKRLEALRDAGTNTKLPILIDKDSLCDGNGTYTLCECLSAQHENHEVCDGDGFLAQRKDGSARRRQAVVIMGGKAVAKFGGKRLEIEPSQQLRMEVKP